MWWTMKVYLPEGPERKCAGICSTFRRDAMRLGKVYDAQGISVMSNFSNCTVTLRPEMKARDVLFPWK